MTSSRGTFLVERGGWRATCRAGERAALEEWLLPDPGARAAAGERLRENRHRVTAAVSWPDGRRALLKVHRPRRGLDCWLSIVRSSRARAEWDAARYLEGAGLPVASPLAYGERRRGGRLVESFFAAVFLEGSRSLDEVAQPSHVLLAEVARAVRRLHDHGFDHRDLHAGNLLVRGADESSAEVVVADLHRVRFGRPLSLRRRVANHGKLVHSLGDRVDEGARLALLGAYSLDATAEELRRLSESLARGVDRIESTRRRSRAKRTSKESTVYTQDVGAGRGSRRRDLPVERIDRALVEHDAAIAAGDARVAKRNRRGVVTVHGDLVVKEAAPSERIARARAALAPWRARAGFVNAHVLGVLGLPTATPLAFVRRDGRTFTLLEDLSSLPRLDVAARVAFSGEDRAAARSLLDASARWVAALHRAGVYHGDIKGVNVRVAGSPEAGWRFHLIDTDRCRFTRRSVNRRRRVKNLAQLAASIPRVVSRPDRLRWWRRYAEGAGGLADERAVARDVAAHLARKVVVVDDPIE